MSRHLKLLLIIVISLIIIAACGFLFLFLYNHPSNNPDNLNGIEGGCCTCLDCPECDVCCDCNNPYLSKELIHPRHPQN